MDKKQLKKEYKNKVRTERAIYKKEKKELKSEYKESLEEYYGSEEFSRLSNPPRRPALEEIGNAVTHGAGALFAIVAFCLMAARANSAEKLAGAIIYFFGLFVMFTSSCLYHAFPWGSGVKRLFRRFDYSCIYLSIGATFAPILLCYFGGAYGLVFCAVQWAVIAAGITFICVFGPNKLRWLHYPLYFLLGWSALAFIPKMIANDPAFFVLVLAGGVIYSLGVIPFALRKGPSHFLWHFFVLFGAVVQWTGIYSYIYCV